MKKIKQWFEKSAAIDFYKGNGLILGFIISFWYIKLTEISYVISIIYILILYQLSIFYILYGKKMFKKYSKYIIIIYNAQSGIENEHKEKLVYKYFTRLKYKGYGVKIKHNL